MKPNRIILLTDTHFGHKSIKEHGYRPSNFEHLILGNLATFSRPQDILIHLGDVSLKEDAMWTKQMFNAFNGKRRWLVRGNHDAKTDNWYINNGWDYVCETLILNYQHNELLFTHKPNLGCTGINIHGHLHSGLHRPKYFNLPEWHKLVSLEHNKYAPILLSEVLK